MRRSSVRVNRRRAVTSPIKEPRLPPVTPLSPTPMLRVRLLILNKLFSRSLIRQIRRTAPCPVLPPITQTSVNGVQRRLPISRGPFLWFNNQRSRPVPGLLKQAIQISMRRARANSKSLRLSVMSERRRKGLRGVRHLNILVVVEARSS